MRNNTSSGISDFKFSTQFVSTLVVAAISIYEVSLYLQNNQLVRLSISTLSGCLPKILITQIGQKIDFVQILQSYVNYTLSGDFKNTFRLGSKCFLRLFTRGVPWWTKMDILLVQKCQFSITLVTPYNT